MNNIKNLIKERFSFENNLFFKRRLRENITGYLFILPVFIFIMIFVYYPVIRNLYLSFFNWRLISPDRSFIGLYNYRRLLNDPYFWNALRITAIYAFVVVPATIVLSLIMALIVNRKMKFRAFFRTAYFVPTVISTASAAIVWVWMYEPIGGLFNSLLSMVGVSGPGWLHSPRWALPSIGIYTTWKDLGFFMIIFLAGLRNIPNHYYEAAKIDGANRWKLFRHITWPLLSPTTFLVLVMGFIRAWKVFNAVHIMTEGGPISRTSVMVYYIYRQAFEAMNIGYGSAIANVFFVIVLGITLVQFWGSKKLVHYQ